jgi:hypothetical protein
MVRQVSAQQPRSILLSSIFCTRGTSLCLYCRRNCSPSVSKETLTAYTAPGTGWDWRRQFADSAEGEIRRWTIQLSRINEQTQNPRSSTKVGQQERDIHRRPVGKGDGVRNDHNPIRRLTKTCTQASSRRTRTVEKEQDGVAIAFKGLEAQVAIWIPQVSPHP